MDYQEEYNQMIKKGKTASTNSQERFRYITIAVVAFVLGFGSAWVSFKSQDVKLAVVDNEVNIDKVETLASVSVPDGAGAANTSEGEVPVVVSIGDVSLAVLDQAPGRSIFVNEVSAEKAVWVVVVENNNGQRGNIIGAGLFDAGETSGVVELLRGTVEGGEYYAALYNEDSVLTEGRTFDLDKDSPLVDPEGKVIEVLFKTSSIPE